MNYSEGQHIPIVCIGFPAWEGDYVKSTVKLMEELARYHPLLYVEYTFTYKDMLMGIMKKKDVPFRRMIGLSKRLRKINMTNQRSLHVLTLPPVFSGKLD